MSRGETSFICLHFIYIYTAAEYKNVVPPTQPAGSSFLTASQPFIILLFSGFAFLPRGACLYFHAVSAFV